MPMVHLVELATGVVIPVHPVDVPEILTMGGYVLEADMPLGALPTAPFPAATPPVPVDQPASPGDEAPSAREAPRMREAPLVLPRVRRAGRR